MLWAAVILSNGNFAPNPSNASGNCDTAGVDRIGGLM